MKRTLIFLQLFPLTICFSSCGEPNVEPIDNDPKEEEYVDIDDLTNADYSGFDLNQQNCFYIKNMTTNQIYYAEIFDNFNFDANYACKENSEYKVSFYFMTTAGSLGYEPIKPSLSFEGELDNFFNNTKWAKASLEKNILIEYLSYIEIYKGQQSYSLDYKGHLVYLENETYYRSSLKINWINILKQFLYCSQKEIIMSYPISHNDIFAYKNDSLSFDEASPYLSNNSNCPDRTIDINRDPTYIYATNLKYRFNDNSPDEDLLTVGNSFYVSTNGKVYQQNNNYSRLFLGYLYYRLNVPYLLESNSGETFTNVFAQFN